jgi:hypothetical protein
LLHGWLRAYIYGCVRRRRGPLLWFKLGQVQILRRRGLLLLQLLPP